MFPRKLFLTPNLPSELKGRDLIEKAVEKQGVGDCGALLLWEVGEGRELGTGPPLGLGEEPELREPADGPLQLSPPFSTDTDETFPPVTLSHRPSLCTPCIHIGLRALQETLAVPGETQDSQIKFVKEPLT